MDHSVHTRGRVESTVVVLADEHYTYIIIIIVVGYTPRQTEYRSRVPSQRQPPGRTCVQYPRG